MRKLLSALVLLSASALAQNTPAITGNYPPLTNFTQEQDKQNMMDQLGITAMRPGPSGEPSSPRYTNVDEAKANPYPNLPNPLILNNGKPVTSADIWWKQRRPEIVEDFEREMYGRVPKNVPKVTWSVVATDREVIGRTPVIAKLLKGHVDNSSYPLINVDIEMMVLVPANATKPVPLLMMFGGGNRLPAPSQPTPAENEKINAALKKAMINIDPSLQAVFEAHPGYQPFAPAAFGGFGGRGTAAPVPSKEPTDVPGVIGINNDPPSTEQLIAAGWGYAQINPTSVQADNGAGITRGIIGLVNKGQPRKPDDWGGLRAWAWGASRGLDYLEANEPMVDAKKVGIEGVSRYGKAALVTMAFDTRFAMVLVGSSGEGGAKLSRRNFGEMVESLTGGAHYWMAGNFMKYASAAGKYGNKTSESLPVDAHELIALCAPRLTFISYGVPEKGDAHWLDQQGSYMATVAAGPVFRLLGAKDIGVTEDYRTAKKPPVNVGLLDGQLAWRQHDQGHEDHANMKWFIQWANKNLSTDTGASKR